MIYLQAPWDVIRTTTMLPNPQLGNLDELAIDTVIRNSTNGNIYSYNKTNNRVKKSWSFILRRGKAEELFRFIETYYGYIWRVTDWEERVYKMHIVNDPLDFTRISKNELTTVNLELEGTQLNG